MPGSVGAMMLEYVGRKVLDHVGRQLFEHLHRDLILDSFDQSFGS
jgi:hypothetical protein